MHMTFTFVTLFLKKKSDFIAKILIYVGLRIRFYVFSTHNLKIWYFFKEIGLKKGFRKTSLNAKEVFRKPKSTFLTFEKNKSNFLNLKFFLKSTRPSLPLKKAPPLISVFSPQGRRGNRSSLSLRTASLYGWRTISGLRQQQSCGFLCGDEPAFTQGFAKGLLARCFFRKTTSAPLNLKSLSKTHQSSLNLKGGSTAFSKPFSPQGTRDVPTALLGAQTASLYGWRTIRGLRQQQSCGFLCGMNRKDTRCRMLARC